MTVQNKTIATWVAIGMAVLAHFSGMVWTARGMMNAVETNKIQIVSNLKRIDKVDIKQQYLVEKTAAHESLREDVKEIKIDVRQMRDQVQRISERIGGEYTRHNR